MRHFQNEVDSMHDKSFAEIQVWAPFIRIAHWTVGLGFFVAYLTEDVTTVHVWAGYIVGVLALPASCGDLQGHAMLGLLTS